MKKKYISPTTELVIVGAGDDIAQMNNNDVRHFAFYNSAIGRSEDNKVEFVQIGISTYQGSEDVQDAKGYNPWTSWDDDEE